MSVQPMGQARPTVDYALAYARLGWPVFPVHWTESVTDMGTGEVTHSCSCRKAACERMGKHPLTEHGLRDATTDGAAIRAWFERWPLANLAVATGDAFWALDIDIRDGKRGDLVLEQLERDHSLIPDTLEARTQSGGRHYLFTPSPGSRNTTDAIGRGVDSRGYGGYILVEPSRVVGSYVFLDWDVLSGDAPPLLRAPEWLAGQVCTAAGASAERPQPRQRHAEPWVLDDLRDALTALNADHYQTWIDMGLALKSLGDDGYWLWSEWSRTSPKYAEHEQRRRWHSFAPERITYETVFWRAQLAGWKNPRSRSADTPPVTEDGLLLDLEQLRQAAAKVRWLVKYLLPADSVGLAFGASGTFKSFLMLDLALHVAHGLDWCGRKTTRAPVVYIAGEGGAGLWNRIHAWHIKRGLVPPENFRVCKSALLLDQATQSASLKRAIAALPWAPRLIIVDTQSQTFSGDENAATEVAGYYRRLSADLREPTGATVVVIHHTGHAVVERPRGSSAILANTDFVLSIMREAEGAMSSVLEVTKQKDGDKVDPLPFVLERIVVDTDEDGDEISSLVAGYHDNVKTIVATAGARLSEQERVILDAFGGAQEMHEAVLRQALADSMTDSSTSTKRQAFWRVMRSLQSKKMLEKTAVGTWGRLQ